MADSGSDTAIVFLEASSSAQVLQQTPESSSSSSGAASSCDDLNKSDEFAEPECKKRKASGSQADKSDGTAPTVPVEKPEQKLESRLGSILGCVVCFDLPNAAVYQVFISWLLSHSFF